MTLQWAGLSSKAGGQPPRPEAVVTGQTPDRKSGIEKRKGTSMKKLLLLVTTLAVLVLAAVACGGDAAQEPAAGDGPPTPSSSAAATAAPAGTPVPAPTRPQRLEGLTTPTAEPGPTRENTPPPSPAKTAPGDGAPATQEPEPTESGPSSTTALPIPENPQTDDRVLLQDIYARMDLEQFALDPAAPIPFPTELLYEYVEFMERKNNYGEPEKMEKSERQYLIRELKEGSQQQQAFHYEDTKDHPYLHLFPGLKYFIDKETEDAARKGGGPDEKIAYSPYSHISGAAKWGRDIEFLPRDGITRFIYNPWFEGIRDNESSSSNPGEYWFGNNSTRGVLAQAVAQVLEDAKYPATRRMPTFWDNAEGRDWDKKRRWDKKPTKNWDLEAYLRTPVDLKHSESSWWGKNMISDGYRRPTGTHRLPVTYWEFVHPRLPIIRITSYSSTILPLTVDPQEATGNELAEKIRNTPPTFFAVSFVISFQNRWTSFDDPNRWLTRFGEDIRGQKLITTETGERRYTGINKGTGEGGIDEDIHHLFPNYWHTSDYMQHRIIGPVVVQVYESEVVKPGIYSTVPRVTHWEAPSYVIPEDSKLLEGVEVREWGWRWLAGLPVGGSPNPNYPLPGHVLTTKRINGTAPEGATLGMGTGPGDEAARYIKGKFEYYSPWEKYEMDDWDW